MAKTGQGALVIDGQAIASLLNGLLCNNGGNHGVLL